MQLAIYINKYLYHGNYCSNKPLIYIVKPFNPLNSNSSCRLHELDATFTGHVKPMLCATPPKYTNLKLFHNYSLCFCVYVLLYKENHSIAVNIPPYKLGLQKANIATLFYHLPTHLQSFIPL